MTELSLGNGTARLNPNLATGRIIEPTTSLETRLLKTDIASVIRAMPAQNPVPTLIQVQDQSVSAQLRVITALTPFVRRITDPSGRVQFDMDFLGEPQQLQISDDAMAWAMKRISDTNQLIKLGAFGGTLVGPLPALPNWEQVFDEFYLGSAIASALAVGVATTAVPPPRKVGGTVSVTTEWYGVKFTLDKKAADDLLGILNDLAMGVAIGGVVGLPFAELLVAVLAVEYFLTKLAEKITPTGVCIVYPNFFFPLLPPQITPRFK